MNTSKNIAAAAITILALATGCDLVQPDLDKGIPPADIHATIFAFAEKPAVINLATVTNGLDLKLDQPTSTPYGQVTPLLGGKYLMYIPNADFTGKTEDVTLTLLGSNNEKFTNLKLKARSLDNSTACDGTTGVYDYAQISPGETIVLDLLDNDIFCNVAYNGGRIAEVALEGVTTNDFKLQLGPGRQASFTYTAPAGFTGKIKVLYDLGINWKNPSTIPADADIVKEPLKFLDAYTTALIEIDVVQ